MGIFDLFRSRRKKRDEGYDFMAQMEAMINEAKEREGTTEEVLSQGQGEFGFSPNNPIPFSSVGASRKYLERLVFTQPGSSEYRWVRSGSVRSEIVSTPVDKYDLLDREEMIIKTIYIWSYNKVDSERAPAGFGLMDK